MATKERFAELRDYLRPETRRKMNALLKSFENENEKYEIKMKFDTGLGFYESSWEVLFFLEDKENQTEQFVWKLRFLEDNDDWHRLVEKVEFIMSYPHEEVEDDLIKLLNPMVAEFVNICVENVLSKERYIILEEYGVFEKEENQKTRKERQINLNNKRLNIMDKRVTSAYDGKKLQTLFWRIPKGAEDAPITAFSYLFNFVNDTEGMFWNNPSLKGKKVAYFYVGKYELTAVINPDDVDMNKGEIQVGFIGSLDRFGKQWKESPLFTIPFGQEQNLDKMLIEFEKMNKLYLIVAQKRNDFDIKGMGMGMFALVENLVLNYSKGPILSKNASNLGMDLSKLADPDKMLEIANGLGFQTPAEWRQDFLSKIKNEELIADFINIKFDEKQAADEEVDAEFYYTIELYEKKLEISFKISRKSALYNRTLYNVLDPELKLI